MSFFILNRYSPHTINMYLRICRIRSLYIKIKTEVVRVIFNTHETSGPFAGVSVCDCIHEMEKTGLCQ